MDGTIESYTNPDTNKTYQYVKAVSLYMTDKYATDFYNSCAHVQFAGGGSHVMNILCGTTECTPKKWLDFMGDPKMNGGEAPFLMQYYLYPNSTPIFDNITPLNDAGREHTFYKCNETVKGLGSCSCADCPIVCPAPPSFSEHHIPFKIIAWSIGTTGVFLSTIIFIAALVSSIYIWQRYKRSGYRPISGPDNSPKSTYGSTSAPDIKEGGGGDKESESSTSSSLNSDVDGDLEDDDETLTTLGRCCQIGHYVERQIKLLFYRWGYFVAKFWYLVLILSIVIAGSLSFGLFFFSVTTDPVKLWSSPNSRARTEMNYFDKNFGPFYRTEQIIIKAKAGIPGQVVSPIGILDKWSFGPVFNISVLQEVRLHTHA